MGEEVLGDTGGVCAKGWRASRGSAGAGTLIRRGCYEISEGLSAKGHWVVQGLELGLVLGSGFRVKVSVLVRA